MCNFPMLLGEKRFTINLKTIFVYILSFSILVENNPILHENTVIRYSLIMMLGVIVLCSKLVFGRKVRIDSYILWLFVVLTIFFFSRFWSIQSQLASQSFKNFFIIAVICVMITEMIENPEDIFALLKGLLWAYGINTLYVVSAVGIENLGTERLGAGYAGLQNWNANSIGEMTAFACVICVLFVMIAYKYSSRRIQRNFYCILSAIFLAVSLLTGSRKSLLYVIGTLLLFSMLYGKWTKKVKHILMYAAAGMILIFVVMQNKVLYELIGARMNRMFQELMGVHTSENSMGTRMLMIHLGILWFKNKPFLGYGLGNYSVLLRQYTGLDTYSHCNFIEILVSVGLIGFFIYYFIYAKIINMLRKKYKGKKDIVSAYFLSFLLVMLILNMAVVCYYDINFNIIILLMYCWSKMKDGTYAV